MTAYSAMSWPSSNRGPIFAVLAWATRRALRNPALKNQARKERNAKSPFRVL